MADDDRQIEVLINGVRYVPMSAKLFEGDNADTRKLALQLAGSLTLCEHMGEVKETVDYFLKLMGVSVRTWYEWPALSKQLGEMGITTLYGTELTGE